MCLSNKHAQLTSQNIYLFIDGKCKAADIDILNIYGERVKDFMYCK